MDRRILIDLLDDFAFGSHDIEQTADRIIELYEQAQVLRIHDVVERSEQFNCFKKNIPNLAHRPCKNWCGDEVCHKQSIQLTVKELKTK